MKKYAVAILSCFDNENKITIIEAEDKVIALKNALVIQCECEESAEDQMKWNESMSNDYEELIGDLFNGELCCCVEEIK